MKKVVFLFILTIVTVLLVSCNNEPTDNDVLQNLESVVKQTTAEADDQFAYLNEIGEWYAPETEYKYDPESDDDSSGIYDEYGNFLSADSRLYFRTKRVIYDHGIHEETMHTYIDIKTGDKHYLCPDPLCKHKTEEGCLIVDIVYLLNHPNKENIIYAEKLIEEPELFWAIYEIDLEQYTEKLLFRCANIYEIATLNSIDDEKLYFTFTKETGRTKDENGNTIVEQEIQEMYIELSTHNIGIAESEKNKYDAYTKLGEKDNRIYWRDTENNRIIMTDSDYNNETTVFTHESGYSLPSIYYDSNTEELYICLCSDDMLREKLDYLDTEDGAIYVIDKENNIRKLEMPTEKITGFQLTNKYIYYTTYDPIDYGYTSFGYPCIVQDGGKIYRVSREDTTTPELVFDAKGELFLGTYTVIGDYLYIDYSELIEEGIYTHFRRVGSTARIHIEDQTIKWLNFD